MLGDQGQHLRYHEGRRSQEPAGVRQMYQQTFSGIRIAGTSFGELRGGYCCRGDTIKELSEDRQGADAEA